MKTDEFFRYSCFNLNVFIVLRRGAPASPGNMENFIRLVVMSSFVVSVALLASAQSERSNPSAKEEPGNSTTELVQDYSFQGEKSRVDGEELLWQDIKVFNDEEERYHSCTIPEVGKGKSKERRMFTYARITRDPGVHIRRSSIKWTAGRRVCFNVTAVNKGKVYFDLYGVRL